MALRAGQLNTLVEIHTATAVRTPHMDTTYTYAMASTAFAGIDWDIGGEQDQDPNVESTRRATVTMRAGTEVKATDQIHFNGQILEVDGPPINVGEGNEMLKVRCVERTNE